MDKGLKFQVELTKRGEKIFSRVSRIVEDLEENDKIYYLMASGMSLCVTEEQIIIRLIFAPEDNIRNRGLGIIKNPYKDRIIAKEAICNYLINNPKYCFEMEKDIFENLTHVSHRDNYSSIHFGLTNLT